MSVMRVEQRVLPRRSTAAPPSTRSTAEDCDAEALKRILLSRMHRQRPITFRMLEQGFVSCQSDS